LLKIVAGHITDTGDKSKYLESTMPFYLQILLVFKRKVKLKNAQQGKPQSKMTQPNNSKA
jgi:hypothetical protein